MSKITKHNRKKCKNDPKKTYKGTEPSPKGLGYCAHTKKVGIKELGRDGNFWIVKKNKDGIKRWIKFNELFKDDLNEKKALHNYKLLLKNKNLSKKNKNMYYDSMEILKNKNYEIFYLAYDTLMKSRTIGRHTFNVKDKIRIQDPAYKKGGFTSRVFKVKPGEWIVYCKALFPKITGIDLCVISHSDYLFSKKIKIPTKTKKEVCLDTAIITIMDDKHYPNHKDEDERKKWVWDKVFPKDSRYKKMKHGYSISTGSDGCYNILVNKDKGKIVRILIPMGDF